MTEHVPPVGWADVATKHDLAQLEERMGVRMDLLRSELRGEMSGLRAKLRSERRKYAFAMLAANIPLVGLVFAAARLG